MDRDGFDWAPANAIIQTAVDARRAQIRETEPPPTRLPSGARRARKSSLASTSCRVIWTSSAQLAELTDVAQDRADAL